MRATYSVYRYKTDIPVFLSGTAAECAKAMGITVDSFYTILSKGKSKKWEIYKEE